MKLLCVVLLIGATFASIAAAARAGDDKSIAPPTVRLVIDFGDGVELHYTALAWRAGLTGLDAMKQAESQRRGVKATTRDFGSTGVLVTQIDDLKNEGPGGRNWLLWVNGAFAAKSISKVELQAGDELTWRYTQKTPAFAKP